MEWQQCSVRGCWRFCDLEYNEHPEPCCCLVCSLTHGAWHSSKCISASYEPGHLFYDSDSEGDHPDDEPDMSTEAGSASADESIHLGNDLLSVNTYVWSTSVDAETSNQSPGFAYVNTRRLRQGDSDWEAFQDSDTDAYSSV